MTDMKIAIELYNSSDCSLDSCVITVTEGDDVAAAIADEMHRLLREWVLSPGDIIKIVELH